MLFSGIGSEPAVGWIISLVGIGCPWFVSAMLESKKVESLKRVRWVIFVGIALALLLGFNPAVPQTKPALQITEPLRGSIVNPGKTLTVKVSSPTPALFPEVALIGGDPIGFGGTISSLPGELSVQIPNDIRFGKHRLTVEGTPKSGGEAVFEAIEIDVERPDLPVSMSATLSGIHFDARGEQIPLIVLANFLDGSEGTSTYDVTESSHIHFSSANTEVATVDTSGQVTAVGPGTGLIAVKYALGDEKLSIGIPVQMPNPARDIDGKNFFISVTPGMKTIEPGGSASFKITASTYTAFTGEIELRAHGLPEGATASFTPVSIRASESATLAISVLRSTPLDTYPIFVTGKSGDLSPTVSCLLIISATDKR